MSNSINLFNFKKIYEIIDKSYYFENAFNKRKSFISLKVYEKI